MDNFIINMVILNTKIVVYKKGKDDGIMKIIDVLHLLYKETKANEYDSEVCDKWFEIYILDMMTHFNFDWFVWKRAECDISYYYFTEIQYK